MVESVLETRGDQLTKAEQIMYLDTAERSAICHYLGIIYTRLIAQKLYGIDCMVPLNLIEQPGRKICKIQRCIPPGSDRIRKAERMERLGAGRQEREQPGGLWKRMPGGVGDREDQ